jgi:hypothetical protein
MKPQPPPYDESSLSDDEWMITLVKSGEMPYSYLSITLSSHVMTSLDDQRLRVSSLHNNIQTSFTATPILNLSLSHLPNPSADAAFSALLTIPS